MLVACLLLCLACAPSAEAEEPAAPAAPAAPLAVGQPAPPFSLPAVDGRTVALADLKGKWVVLEWYNPDCPYIRHAHGADGPLRGLPRKWGEQGVAWLAINSGAPGQEGHGADRNRASAKEYDFPGTILLDEPGTVGRAYQAKNTPTIYVIDPQGVLVYWGGLDNAPRGVVPAEGYRPYADQALEDALAGRPLRAAKTRPYG